MHNALAIPEVSRIVQVAVRDFSDGEQRTVAESGGRVTLFEDRVLARRRFEGESWSSIADAIVGALKVDSRGFIPEFSVFATNPF